MRRLVNAVISTSRELPQLHIHVPEVDRQIGAVLAGYPQMSARLSIPFLLYRIAANSGERRLSFAGKAAVLS